MMMIAFVSISSLVDSSPRFLIHTGCFPFSEENTCSRKKVVITKEEARDRSPTLSILRALQTINKGTRFEGEAVMSAPPFFESAGRGDLKFLGEDDGPIVVVWESLSESEKEQRSKRMGQSRNWVVWCRSREKD